MKIRIRICLPLSYYRSIQIRKNAYLVTVRSAQLASVEEFPCLDFPVQSNFGSLHSASLSVFFDFDKMSQSQSDQALSSFVGL
jgi:hypothetical protein